MKNIQSELGRLKKGIDEAKNNKAKLEGREQELLTQLQNDHNLASIESAEKEVTRLKSLVVKREEEIRTQFDTLKSKYDW